MQTYFNIAITMITATIIFIVKPEFYASWLFYPYFVLSVAAIAIAHRYGNK